MTAPAPAPVSARDLVPDTRASGADVLHGRLDEVAGTGQPVAHAPRLAGYRQP